MFLMVQDFDFSPNRIKIYQILPFFTKFPQILSNLSKFTQLVHKFDQNFPKFTQIGLAFA